MLPISYQSPKNWALLAVGSVVTGAQLLAEVQEERIITTVQIMVVKRIMVLIFWLVNVGITPKLAFCLTNLVKRLNNISSLGFPSSRKTLRQLLFQPRRLVFHRICRIEQLHLQQMGFVHLNCTNPFVINLSYCATKL